MNIALSIPFRFQDGHAIVFFVFTDLYLHDDKEQVARLTQLVEAGVTPHYAHENKSYLTSLLRLPYHPNPSLTHVSPTGRRREQPPTPHRQARHVPRQPLRARLHPEEEQVAP